jgi:SAM-dependent methyltransferase
MLKNGISTLSASPRQLLHVGCGQFRPERLPSCFQAAQWQEIRLDIDPQVKPNIIGSITDLSAIENGSMDAIWSSHNLEHLNSYEVPIALTEFKRVLKLNGFVLLSVPNLRAVAQHIANDQLSTTLYQSAAGPITALDIVFGHQASQASGNHFMAHRTGFTSSTLGQSLLDAGFYEVRVHEGRRLDLWAIATMPYTSPELFNDLAGVLH